MRRLCTTPGCSGTTLRGGRCPECARKYEATIDGAIDPHSMHTTEQGLVVAGEIDRDTDEGRQTWAIKSGVVGFSIGGIFETRPRNGGGRTVVEVDLLEISATSKPAHPHTRALSWKAFEVPRPAAPRYRLADGRVVGYEEMLVECKALTRASTPIRVEVFEC